MEANRAPRRNWCHNAPRPVAGSVTHWAQNGWREVDENWGNVSLHPIWKGIRHVMTTDCQYTKTTPDKACEGCCHQVLKP